MDITYIVIVVLVILLSMTLHEAMHAFMGYWLGDDTAEKQGRLTLNPLRHIDPFLTVLLPVVLAIVGAPIFGAAKPVPFNPDQLRGGEWGAALVAFAGPLTNLLLAFISFGIGVVSGVITSEGVSVSLWGTFLAVSVSVNLGFFVFNMIPLPPLDGSRVLYALAPEFVRRGMEQLERYGLVVIFVLVLVGSAVLGPLMSTLISAILASFEAVFRL